MIYPGIYDFTAAHERAIPRGTTFSNSFKDITTGGVILNLTGAVVTCEFRPEKERTSTPMTALTVVVDVGDQAYLSRITISLTAAQTGAITPNKGFYDIKVLMNGVTTCYISGKFEFEGSVTA